MFINYNFKQRLWVSSIGILTILFSIAYSYIPWFQPLFVSLNVTLVGLALAEFYQLARHKNLNPLMPLGLACAGAYIVSIYLSIQQVRFDFLPSWVLFVSFTLFFLVHFNQRPNPLSSIAVTLFGIAYVAIPLSHILKINYMSTPSHSEDGRLWLIYTLAVTKCTDIGGYLFGKMLGRVKLAPSISPKKTVEGALGGVLTSLACSLLFYLFVKKMGVSMTLTLHQSIGYALLLSIAAQFGDLSESLLKRDAKVKDSSHLPGLGGMLDIIDSLVFTLPLMYFILKTQFEI